MEHILITNQNSNVEVVDSNIIHKLAEVTQDCDATSSLTGNLQTTKAYKKDVDFLLAKFPNLQINATQGLYVDFADRGVEQALANTIGDGTGITTANISGVTNLNGNGNAAGIKGNIDIVSFDEFIDWSNCQSLFNAVFDGCVNLKSIGIPRSLVNVATDCFKNCLFNRVIIDDLDSFIACEWSSNGRPTVGDWNVSKSNRGKFYIRNQVTKEIEELTTLTVNQDVTPQQKSGRGASFRYSNIKNIIWNTSYNFNNIDFSGCKIDNCIIAEGSTDIGYEVFNEGAVKRIDMPSTTTSITSKAFRRLTNNDMVMICRASVPPSVGSENQTPAVLYVPDANIADYQSASWWSGIADIRGISTLQTSNE